MFQRRLIKNKILKYNFSRFINTHSSHTNFGLRHALVDDQSPPIRCDSAKQALQCVKSESKVFLHSAAAVPTKLIDGLVEKADELRNVQLYQIHTEDGAPYVDHPDSFFTNCLFVGSNTRAAVNDGRAAYIPVFLGQIPKFLKTTVELDVALIHVSPPDKHGFCSLGVSVDCTEAAVQCAKTVVAQVNPNMPRALGDGLIHVNAIDYLIDVDDQLPEHPMKPVTDVSRQIGQNVAALIEDGATLQMGIGEIPNAVLASLENHRDLGIHTEMFSDGMLTLAEKGVITNRNKNAFANHSVSTFCVGSRALYDYVDDNPSVLLLRVEDTNNPAIIGRNPKVAAINSAIEIDLTGQVCADSIGEKIYSGVGGQIDFMTGAALSEGGKPIIAMPSTVAKTGKSRIVPCLTKGGGVVTTRAHVQHVVTEYGSVDLFGKNVWQRAEALISIAHPNHRDALANDLEKRAPKFSR